MDFGPFFRLAQLLLSVVRSKPERKFNSMFKKSKKSVKSLSITIFSLVLVGCGSGNFTKSNDIAGQKNSSTRNLLCENPIQLEDQDLESVSDVAFLPKKKFKLARIRFHEFWENARHSITVSADRTEGFQAKLECDGFHNGEDHQINEFSSFFQVSDSVDFDQRIKSDLQRKISYDVENSEVVNVISKLVRKSKYVERSFDHISTERVALKNDRFLTYRFYVISQDKLELRIKLENTPNQSGDRQITFFSAIYDAAN